MMPVPFSICLFWLVIDSNSNWGMKSLKILTSRARPRFLRIRCSKDGQWLEDWDCIVLCALVSENVKSVHWLVKSMSCVSTGLIVTFRSLTNWLIDVWESELSCGPPRLTWLRTKMLFMDKPVVHWFENSLRVLAGMIRWTDWVVDQWHDIDLEWMNTSLTWSLEWDGESHEKNSIITVWSLAGPRSWILYAGEPPQMTDLPNDLVKKSLGSRVKLQVTHCNWLGENVRV